MITRTVAYRDDELDVTIEVAKANNRIGAKHNTAIIAVGNYITEHPDDDQESNTLRWTFAAVEPATLSVTGLPWPMTFEQFADVVPEELSTLWFEAVSELNSHWWRTTSPSTSDQKKATSAT